VNPNTAANVVLGAGIYSEAFCITAGLTSVSAPYSNCMNTFTSGTTTPTGRVTARIVNALELSWALPYAVPSDDTSVSMDCVVKDSEAAGNWKIYPSSIVTSVGVGNCFYSYTLGVSATSDEEHGV